MRYGINEEMMMMMMVVVGHFVFLIWQAQAK